PLDWVVGARVLLTERRPDSLPRKTCSRGDEVILEMTPRSQHQISQANKTEYPSRLKMKGSAPAVLIVEHVPITCWHAGSRRWDRDSEQRRRQDISGFAPIETRMRNDDFKSGEE